MLEIYVSNQKVDLPTDIQIALTIENPMMLQDRIPTPYSLTFTLPPTSKNLRLFGHPNRIPSFASSTGVINTTPCRILFQPFTLITGVMNTTEYDGGIKAAFKGADLTDVMRQSIYSTFMDDYVFATNNWEVQDPDDPLNWVGRYRDLAISAANGGDPKFTAAPVKVNNGNYNVVWTQEVKSRSDTTNTVARFTQRMLQQEYINYYNPETEEFALRSDDPPPRGEPFGFIHSAMFPMVRVHHIFSRYFGPSLVNNIFSVGELADLVMPSTYFHRWIETASRRVQFPGPKGMMFNNRAPFGYNPIYPPGTPTDPYFRLNSFMPDFPGPDLLKDVLKLFSASMVVSNGTFRIVLNKDIMAADLKAKWDDKMIGYPVMSMQKGQSYKYGYDGEETFAPDDELTTVATIHDMINDPYDVEDNEELEVVYHITSTNQYYRKTIVSIKEDSEPEATVTISYELLDGGYGAPFNSQNETFEAVSTVKPMPMLPFEYWWTVDNSLTEHPDLAWWWVPYFDGERKDRPTQAHIMFHRGMVSSAHTGHEYPLVSPYAFGPDGSRVGNISLQWEGPDGLLANFHSEFRSWINKHRIRFKGSFLLTPLDLHNLDITSKIHLKGRNFYIERIQVNIRHNRIDPAVVDLIEV